MSVGILGAYNLYKNVVQAAYVNNYENSSVVSINLCNKTNQVAYVSLAVSDSATTPALKDYIEYDSFIPPKGVIERTSIMVNSGQYVVVQSSTSDVNIVVYGVEHGDEVVSPVTLTQSSGLSPTWVSATTFYVDSGTENTTAVEASGPEEGEELTYALVGGTLPTGLSLQTDGSITGSTTGTGTTTVTISATDDQGNTSNKVFNITRRYLDGSTPALAAPSANYIATYIPGATSDFYYLRGYDDTPMYAFCSMDGTEAGSSVGGWMRFDEDLLAQYRGSAIREATYAYIYRGGTQGWLYERQVQDLVDGTLTGVRWDFGPYAKFIAMRVRSWQFMSYNGPDQSGFNDSTASSPTDTQIVNMFDNRQFISGNYSSMGVSLGNGGVGGGNLVRTYNGANIGGIWSGEVSGNPVRLNHQYFNQSDSQITDGRYVYWYESDGTTEYNNPFSFQIYLR